MGFKIQKTRPKAVFLAGLIFAIVPACTIFGVNLSGEENPLVGTWQEKAQLSCEDGSEVVPPALIGELELEANGRFSVTWIPFESYRDYWGAYSFDPGTGILKLTVERGNHIPAGIDGSGRAHIDENGRLILTEMWLGEPNFESLRFRCGHIFE